MNIFFTNSNPVIAANDHCTIHRNKMIVEQIQLLSAAHHILDGEQAIQGIYKLTHKNHPSAVWTRQSQAHYNWVLQCTRQLLNNYTNTTGKIHASEKVYKLLIKPPINLVTAHWVKDPTIAAPDKFKAVAVFKGVAVAYQQYLCEKFAEWQQRDKPIKVIFSEGVPSWYK